MPGERTTRPSWQGLFLRTVAMAHHFYVRATLAELEADALRTQRDAAVEDNAALLLALNHILPSLRSWLSLGRLGGGRKKGDPGIMWGGIMDWTAQAVVDAATAPHPGTGYRARVRAELLRELAMERRAVLASGGVEVSNEVLADHFEAQAVEEEAAATR